MGYAINSCIRYNNNYLSKRFVQKDVINESHYWNIYILCYIFDVIIDLSIFVNLILSICTAIFMKSPDLK